MVSKKQEKLDEIKWYIGNELGFDPCGTFEYCCKCNKQEENPCEKALKRYKDCKRKQAKRQQSKAQFGETQFRATIVENK